MEMTVTELMERLEEIAEDNPEAIVRMATQPSWPLQFKVAGIATSHDLDSDEDSAEGEWQDVHYDCEDRDFATGYCRSCDDRFSDYAPDHDTRGSEGDEPFIVWIVEGGHPFEDSPYAPGRVFETEGALR